MVRKVGAASDYYRLRVTRLDVSDGLDLEWRDDILFRRPPSGRIDEYESWRVQAVNLDDDSDVVSIGSFDTEAEAYEWLGGVAQDLDEATVADFDKRYVAPARRLAAEGL